MKQVKSTVSADRNQEVEYRALLTQEQRSGIFQALESMGGKPSEPELLHDVYFCPKETRHFEEVEMNHVGSYSLRIRESKARGKAAVELNVKVITTQGDHRSWAESEVELSDALQGRKILEAIGQKSFFELQKTRYPFSLPDDCSVFIEDIKDYGPIIEVEVMTTKESEDSAKARIAKLLSDLSIKEDQIVPKSVTNILMRKMSNF